MLDKFNRFPYLYNEGITSLLAEEFYSYAEKNSNIVQPYGIRYFLLENAIYADCTKRGDSHYARMGINLDYSGKNKKVR